MGYVPYPDPPLIPDTCSCFNPYVFDDIPICISSLHMYTPLLAVCVLQLRNACQFLRTLLVNTFTLICGTVLYFTLMIFQCVCMCLCVYFGSFLAKRIFCAFLLSSLSLCVVVLSVHTYITYTHMCILESMSVQYVFHHCPTMGRPLRPHVGRLVCGYTPYDETQTYKHILLLHYFISIIYLSSS